MAMDIVMSSFVISWMCCQCAMGVVLVERIPMFSMFVDNGFLKLYKWLRDPSPTDVNDFASSSVV